MEQRERPQRVTVDDLDDLDCAYEAMSLDGKGNEGLSNPSPDELFEAYTGYMEVIKGVRLKSKQKVEGRKTPESRRTPQAGSCHPDARGPRQPIRTSVRCTTS